MTPARLLLISAALVGLSACATTAPLGPPPPPPPGAGGPPSAGVFRPGDFAWSAVPGRGRIDGRMTFHSGVARYTCAGAGVVLTPETLWTRRRMTILYNSPDRSALPAEQVRARTPSAPSGDYSAFVRRTTCDASDRFNFQGLANGAWFVITVAKPVGGSGPDMAIMRRVEIRAGKPVALEL
ncbi:hypothetical protein [Phenylobacterium sp.]|uniref:hypothetical protein n=1 Tax=Phenylobacterium sp. TaxID=1871053 RepID=UPI00286E44BD|nr:hypothetical protein [Phenylobacterium sp.]